MLVGSSKVNKSTERKQCVEPAGKRILYSVINNGEDDVGNRSLKTLPFWKPPPSICVSAGASPTRGLQRAGWADQIRPAARFGPGL